MIEVQNLTVVLTNFSLRNLRFRIPENAYCMLMGETGSGKSTILESICGLRKPDSGTILLAGNDVTHAKPGERNIGYVPQDGVLFPTMRIQDQIEFPMRIRRWGKKIIASRVNELADLLGISYLLTRKPVGLSGGERQRVALARSLAYRPQVLCMDEPLSALDETTRTKMHALLKQVHRHEHTTVLHVTHSTDESRILGTHFLHLHDGQIDCPTLNPENS